ncbi:MAG: hypothetical protein J2P37_09245 [Ktedonobacteraceae bacterium]|nr:hypothetical protein [Ktedonobacteraceae bacterium]
MPENTSYTDVSELSPKQSKLIAALLAGHPIIAAAQIAGCNEKTAHLWLKLPHVQQAYKEAQSAVFDEAINLLITDIGEARATLRDIMKDTEAPAATRTRAAQILLEQAIALRETSELKERVTLLEAKLQEKHL